MLGPEVITSGFFEYRWSDRNAMMAIRRIHLILLGAGALVLCSGLAVSTIGKAVIDPARCGCAACFTAFPAGTGLDEWGKVLIDGCLASGVGPLGCTQ